MAGDKIDIFGKSYYFQNAPAGGCTGCAIPVLELLTGLMGTPTGAVANSHTTATELNGITNVTGPINSSFLNNPGRNNTSFPQRPKAFINYLFLDEQFRYVDGGFSAVNNTAGLKDHFSDLQNRVALKNGYVYIYVSNESQVNVFFDNLQVVHTRGPILEETHYYPFGLIQSGISSKGLNVGGNDANCGCPNKKGYNGNEIQNKEFSDGNGLEVYDFNARTYDQQIGKFLQIDPKTEEAGQDALTPYQFGLNNPVRYNDPSGECPICPFIPLIIKAFVAGAAIDAGTQVVANKIQGQTWGESFNNVNLKQSAVSGGFSVLSAGTSNFVGGTKAATTITKAFVQTGLEAGESATNQYLQNGTIDPKKMLTDVVMDKTGGVLTKNVNANGIKSAENQLDRAQRVAAGDPISSGRQQKLINAGNNLTTQQVKANAASDATGNALQEAINGVRKALNSNSTSTSNQTIPVQGPLLLELTKPKVDHTRVVKPIGPIR